MDIKAAVKQLTHKHKTNNPYELAQLLNIIVMYAELGSTWGYYTTYKRSKFIIINQNISEELQNTPAPMSLGTVFYIKAYRRHSSKPIPFSA